MKSVMFSKLALQNYCNTNKFEIHNLFENRIPSHFAFVKNERNNNNHKN